MKPDQINKILFITLSNIGDSILTLPTLDSLMANFPKADISVMAGIKTSCIFEGNPRISQVIVYDKHASLRKKIKLFTDLKKERFDLVVDLRNSFFGVLLPRKLWVPSLPFIPKNIRHMKDRHAFKLKELGIKMNKTQAEIRSLYISGEDRAYIEKIMKENDVYPESKIAVIAPGARSHIKRWPKEYCSELIKLLGDEFNFKIILVGDKNDAEIAKFISVNSKYPVLNLVSRTNIKQLAWLLKKSELAVTNDSATMHLASYLNKPVVSVFGPTNEDKYEPWSDRHLSVKKHLYCRPCEKAQCRFGTLECMYAIKAKDVFGAVKNLLDLRIRDLKALLPDGYRRILIVRTDRIGDVLLSTPVIKALRDAYPFAYIAIMVSPYARDIVEGNPYLDEVIVYDKEGKHKSWVNSMKFSLRLRRKRFDLAVILHPTNRVHLVTFFARIPRRVGYNRKLGYLLTDKLEHLKQMGEKHELEYNLDVLRHLGIEFKDKNIYMPIREDSEEWVEKIFENEGIKESDKLLALHPTASCPSKIWPMQRFAQVADTLSAKYGFKVLVIADQNGIAQAQTVIKNMRNTAINLAGRTSVSQLASVLKRCILFISNDSGPVHIASAVGTPVISIFGRSQNGLSPKRWGPVGRKDRFLHKEVGCIRCLAHNCTKEFACLEAISVEDVLKVAEEILDAG